MHFGDVTPPAARPQLDQGAAHVLAIDLGTGGPKAAVVASNGRIAGHAFRPVGLELTPDGGAEQDPEEWWSAATAASRQAIEASDVSPDHIVGVGCTAQWLGTVPVDRAGRAIGPAIIWMDSRGARAVREIVGGRPSVLGYDARKAARWIRMTGGVPSISGKDPVGHINYLAEARPEVVAATCQFLEPVDYLGLRMTGRACASFDSIAMHWVTDNRRIGAVAYDPTLLRWARLDPATLPELVAPGSVIGGLTPAAAEDLGLHPGTRVVAGTGDLHSAAVGSGAVEDFAAHLYVGTSGWVSCHVPFKKTDPLHNVASLPSGLPGRYVVADAHETAGASLTFLRDLVFADDGLPGDLGPDGLAPDDAFDRLNRVAERVPAGSNGVLFTPWLLGERTPVDDHIIRGGFHNLSLSTTRADMVRAVFEGVALNTKWLLDAVEHFVGRPFESLAFIGGGANSELWAQVHADVLERTVKRMDEPRLANVRGAGLVTLRALGLVRTVDIPGMVQVASVHRPNPDDQAGYRGQVEELVEIYKRTKGIHRRRARRTARTRAQ